MIGGGEGWGDKYLINILEIPYSFWFDIYDLQVLQSLPDSWSVHIISQFLSRAVRKSMNLSRNTRIERMMSRGENLRVKQTSIELQREFVTMNDDR